MPDTSDLTLRSAQRNVALYPWFQFLRNLVFWQAIWFLYFQDTLSASEAILLFIFYDLSTTLFELPSGYMSDRLGRRMTLIVSAAAGCLGSALLGFGQGFATFALAQILLGASTAFSSGTDSAFLYESLLANDRENDVETQELKAWRFSFSGLALSALLGGALALWSQSLPFIASAIALVVLLGLTLAFREPAHRDYSATGISRLQALQIALSTPVLLWLFALGMLMYVFSHIPFVFGQPFILDALAERGWSGQAPMVSGIVSASMMVLSLLTSLLANRLRERLGLAGILLFAFSIQIALVSALAISNSAFVIALLFLRMVPNSLSRPFMLARIQPELRDDSRATFLSLQSLGGRLLLSGSLFFASMGTSAKSPMLYGDLRIILALYAMAGIFAITLLALTIRKSGVNRPVNAPPEASD